MCPRLVIQEVNMTNLKTKCISAAPAMLAFYCLIVAMSTPASGQEKLGEYKAALAEWKQVYLDIYAVHEKFKFCTEPESVDLQTEYRDLKARGDVLANQTIELAAEAYAEGDDRNIELEQLLQQLPERYYSSARYERSAKLGMAILTKQKDNDPLKIITLRSAFFANDFALAEKLVEDWKAEHGAMPPEFAGLEPVLPSMKAAWERELKIREKETAENTLPRIQFDTDKGSVVVELFENHAPANVINNLMHSVQSTNFLQNMDFFYVVPHQFALFGCPKGDGSGVARLGTIKKEDWQNARAPFRGTLTMEVNKIDGAVLSAFRFNRIPMPDLADDTIVVGRVIEGMDIVDRLVPTHERTETGNVEPIAAGKPDRLVGALVNRCPDGKRYEFQDPKKVK